MSEDKTDKTAAGAGGAKPSTDKPAAKKSTTAKAKAATTAETAKTRAVNTAEAAKARATAAADAVSEKASKAGEDAGNVARDTGAAIGAGAKDAGEAISNTAKEAADRARKFAQENESATKPGKPGSPEQTRIAHAAYLLQLLGPLTVVSALAAVMIGYLRKDHAQVRDTLLKSHFQWIIMSFWYGLVGLVVSFLTMFIGIGFLLLIALSIWFVYRIVKGWLALNDNEEIANPNALW